MKLFPADHAGLERRAVFAVIIFLTASFSFAAGLLASHNSNHAPIIIEACSDISRAQKK